MKVRDRKRRKPKRDGGFTRKQTVRNPLRIDPTRTATLRRQFSTALRKRFARLKLRTVQLVAEEDAFGLKKTSHDPFSADTRAVDLSAAQQRLKSLLANFLAENAFCPGPVGVGEQDNSCGYGRGTGGGRKVGLAEVQPGYLVGRDPLDERALRRKAETDARLAKLVKDGKVTVFHGTSKWLAENIKTNGLKARRPAEGRWKNLPDQPRGVYCLTSKEEAVGWADAAIEYDPSKEAVIVEAEVPVDWLKPDPLVEGSLYVSEDVPPDKIKAIIPINRRPFRWDSPAFATDFSFGGREEIRNAKTRRVWFVFVVDREDATANEENCGTGAGGFQKGNTCAGESGEGKDAARRRRTVRVFHGTESALLEQIKKEGLKAKVPDADRWGEVVEGQPKGVYCYFCKTGSEESERNALDRLKPWVLQTMTFHGSDLGLVIEAEVPADWLNRDRLVDDGALYVDRDVPPSMLRSVRRVKRKYDPLVQDATWEAEKVPLSLNARKAKTARVWVVFVVKPGPAVNTRWRRFIHNAYCATGPGGGEDNSCGYPEALTVDGIDFDGEKRQGTLYVDVRDPEHWESQGGAHVDRGVEVTMNPSLEGIKNWLMVSREVKVLPLGSQLIAWDQEGVHHVPMAKALGWPKKVSEESRLTIRQNRETDEITVEDNYGTEDTLEHFFSGLTANALRVINARWQFASSAEKLKLFQAWLRTQIKREITSAGDEALWRAYVEAGFKKGAGRAFDDTKKIERRISRSKPQTLDFYAGTKDQFLRSTFGQPVAIEAVKVLAARSFAELEGITEQMSTRMVRTLADGLVQGKGPRDIAADLAADVDISKERALVIARTEIVRAHSEGQLDAMEQLGVEEVGVAVEWSTAGDERVCKRCAPLEGVVLTLAEAHGMIPRHPQCRCAFLPAGVGEGKRGQTSTKKGITEAIDLSLTMGGGEENDTWGPAETIAKKRPESILNAEDNCGTGAGGFQPGNTCGRGDYSWHKEPGDHGKILMVPVDSLVAKQDEGHDPEASERHVEGLARAIGKSTKVQALAAESLGDGKYRVIDGKHRLRALRRLGVETVGIQVSNVTALDDRWFPPVPPASAFSCSVVTSWPAVNYSVDQLRDESGRWTREGAGELVGRVLKTGGFTYSPVLESSPKTGMAVSAWPEAEKILKPGELTEEAIVDWLREHADAFADPKKHFGAWQDEEGKVFLDLVEAVNTAAEAEDAARQHDQEGYHDLARGETVIVKKASERRLASAGTANAGRDKAAPADAWPAEIRFGGRPARLRPRIAGEAQRRWEAIANEFNPDQPRDDDGKWSPVSGETASEAVRRVEVVGAKGRGLGLAEVHVDPTRRGLLNWLKKLPRDGDATRPGHELKGFVEGGRAYVWEGLADGETLYHDHVHRALGLDELLQYDERFDVRLSKGKVVVESFEGPMSGEVHAWARSQGLTVNEFNPDQPRDDAGKWTSTGGGTAAGASGRSALSKMARAVVAGGASAMHADHVAKAWLIDRVDAAMAKLPSPFRQAAEATWWVVRAGTKAAFSTWIATQRVAEEVSLERGLSAEEARQLRGILTSVDVVTVKGVFAGVTAAVSAATGGLATFVPPATAGYLLYSTATNPLATMRAAGNVVEDALAEAFPQSGESHRQGRRARPEVEELSRNNVTANASKATTDKIADALEEHGWDDWHVALLCAALDRTGDLDDSLDLACDLYSQKDDWKPRVTNAFCPTGEDGGIDNSCPPHPTEGLDRAEQDQWLAKHASNNPEGGYERSARYRKGLLKIKVADERAVKAAAIKAIQTAVASNVFARPTVAKVWEKVKEQHPDLKILQFHAVLARAQAAGEIEIGPWTQAPSTLPHPEHAIPHEGGIGYWLAIREARNAWTTFNAEDNCGTGAGGFQFGNTCATGTKAVDLRKVASHEPAGKAEAGGLPDGRGVGRGAGGVESQGGSAAFAAPLRGAPATAKIGGRVVAIKPNPAIRKVAEDYCAKAGIDYRPPTEYVKVDRERAKRIADAFDRMKDDPEDPEVKAAYEAMSRETIAQYEAILATGFKPEFIDYAKMGDPYTASPRLSIEDINDNNHMWVFPTSAGFGSSAAFDAAKNPLLADSGHIISGKKATINDLFRVVHDYFGHAKEGNGMRADGEENAWRSHSAMYSPLARRAMTSETRGQNSWMNFGPHAEKSRTASAADTVYADQKVGLLPRWASEEGSGRPTTGTVKNRGWLLAGNWETFVPLFNENCGTGAGGFQRGNTCASGAATGGTASTELASGTPPGDRSIDSKLDPFEAWSLDLWLDGEHAAMRRSIAAGKPSDRVKAVLSALKKAPLYEGVAYRGLDEGQGAALLVEALEKAGVGGTWTDRAPHSMTVSAEQGLKFSGAPSAVYRGMFGDEPRDVEHKGVLMRLAVKTSRYVGHHEPDIDLPGGPASAESEAVGLPGTAYRIKAIRRDVVIGDRRLKVLVDLEEVR